MVAGPALNPEDKGSWHLDTRRQRNLGGPLVLRPRITRLPDFKSPPLVEVALAVQFEPLETMRVVDLGLLWNQFRERYPRCEEQPPLNPMVEKGTWKPTPPHGLQIEVTSTPPLPRLWLLDASDSGLVQIQPDRFAYNWRARDRAYPRFSTVRDSFIREFTVFRAYVEEHLSSPLLPTLCEVAYIDLIPRGDVWQRPGQLDSIVTWVQAQYSDDYLGEPESASIGLRYTLADDNDIARGQLSCSVRPALSKRDGSQNILMELSARGRPLEKDLNGVLAFFQLGHEAIVRAFASLTTPRAHELWGRHDTE